MKRILLSILVLAVVASTAWGKRGPAPVVDPVLADGVKYVAPNDNGRRGYIQAWDIATSELLWEETVYTVATRPLLEEDVQWVFIAELTLVGDSLVAKDERGKTYAVNRITGQEEVVILWPWVLGLALVLLLCAAGGILRERQRRKANQKTASAVASPTETQ